jgi:hypothetical protein
MEEELTAAMAAPRGGAAGPDHLDRRGARGDGPSRVERVPHTIGAARTASRRPAVSA